MSAPPTVNKSSWEEPSAPAVYNGGDAKVATFGPTDGAGQLAPTDQRVMSSPYSKAGSEAHLTSDVVDQETASPRPAVQPPIPTIQDERTREPAALDSHCEEHLVPGRLSPGEAQSMSNGRRRSNSRQRFAAVAKQVEVRVQVSRRFSASRPNLKKPCSKRTELQLTFESFVIEDGTPADGTKRPNFYGKRRMGTYTEIRQRSESCELCELLVKSLKQMPCSSEDPEVDKDNAKCQLFWTVDGREHVKRTYNNSTRIVTAKRTRRLAIEWQSGSYTYKPSYIVLVAPNGKFLPNGTANPQGELDRPTFFLGRKLTSLDKANTELVKDWLHLCQDHHPDCAIDHANTKFRNLSSEPSFCVLNVEQMCLDTLPDGAKYVALSYIWGPSNSTVKQPLQPDSSDDSESRVGTDGQNPQSTPSRKSVNGDDADDAEPSNQDGRRSTDPPTDRFRTTDDNIEGLEEPNGVGKCLNDMAVAIQNAIALTRHLGFKYIWIDSLCIIQGNEESWDNNARLMDVIYGHAELTICAADGTRADSGLEALYGDRVSQLYRPAQDAQVIVSYSTRSANDAPLELMLSWPPESYVACSR